MVAGSPSARSFGAAEIGELALRLEQEAGAGSLAGSRDLIAALEASFERTQVEFRAQREPPDVNGAGSAPTSPETRIAELERRIASLERSVVGLLSRVD